MSLADGFTQTQTAITQALLVGAARALNLIERMNKRFKARGWDTDDRVHIAVAAVSCVKLNVPKTSFRIAPGTDDPPCWKSIVGSSSAERVVEALELRDMLKPEVIVKSR